MRANRLSRQPDSQASSNPGFAAEFYVMVVVAGFAMWHMGVAFVVGVILDTALRKEWIKI